MAAVTRPPQLLVQGRANESYFAPDSRYAVGATPDEAAAEFRSLVMGLHARGLEVLVQVCIL